MAHLMARATTTGDLMDAVRRAYDELRGHYAFVAMTRRRARACWSAPARSARWWWAWARASRFIASAIPAFLAETRRVQCLTNDEIVVL